MAVAVSVLNAGDLENPYPGLHCIPLFWMRFYGRYSGGLVALAPSWRGASHND